jgi:phosphopantothenoylcysteine decarboxylase / phosphopantothenate---cysteine ligase
VALIALGVTGGIGAYKSVEVARELQKRDHEVVAIMTRAALKFVGEVTFEAITRRRVITDQYASGANADIEHISLASSAALLLVAPATANVIGKFANGIADDFLSSLYLATRAPVLMAPAMNTNMLEHDAVRKNLSTLAARGVRFVEPGAGYLACGWIGKGRLAEPEDIVRAAERLLQSRSSLKGRRVLVTAGPTIEDLDPVRFIGNRSSGRMGFAVAREAHDRGAEVVLIAGPTSVGPPPVGEIVSVRSAREMHAAVLARAVGVDAIIMAAAVADYAPAGGAAAAKIEKGGPLTLALERTPDILADLGERRGDRRRPILIGFAAQTGDVLGPARRKLESKRLDLIVANDISAPGAGFDVATNQVALVSATDVTTLPLMAKSDVASAIVDRLEQLLLTPQAEASAPASR